jgi:asparagine synthetase B (glutamine-hydrolysing)
MCGIFGVIGASDSVDFGDLRQLAAFAESRGKDSSGLMFYSGGDYQALKADSPITRLLLKSLPKGASRVILGHSRLITNGLSDNQPVLRDGLAVFHNGIIVNSDTIWPKIKRTPLYKIDSEIIAGIAADKLASGCSYETIPAAVLEATSGVVACALAMPSIGKLALFSNNGSLYVGAKGTSFYFSSEFFPLSAIGCSDINQVKDVPVFLDIPPSATEISVSERNTRTQDLIPSLVFNSPGERLLQYPKPLFRRCARCILPETMPFISFSEDGVCNYCENYRIRNNPKPKQMLLDLLEPYRRRVGNDCIVPFSGGRDSSYSLHMIVNELKMKPIAYTYDWGMVTDLGRRNISRMCAALGVENIVVAADIEAKRRNIAMNVKAWLRSPNLGMVSIFTAGDKHFFRYLETVKNHTGINLNIWGANPLEVTHFKAGFLGVPPDFAMKTVYNSGWRKQADYQSRRFRAMLQSPGYFNSSLWDTLSGEYYRALMPKRDYFDVFDYSTWSEPEIDSTLRNYDWERAEDTSTTWRIGDGTAAFYNYIYRLVAGFTEHDTFRSNQIREGQISRDQALLLIEDENRPRYANLKWYLDAIQLDFEDTIQAINRIPRLYQEVR